MIIAFNVGGFQDVCHKNSMDILFEKFSIEAFFRYPGNKITYNTCVVKYGQEVADAALEQCINKRLYSANDFKAFAESLKKPEPEATLEIKPLGDESARMLANFDPGRSSISTYQGVWNS